MNTSESTSNSGVADVLAGIEEGLAAAWVARDRSFIEAALADDWTVTDPAGRILTQAQVLEEGFVSGERQIVSGSVDDVVVPRLQTGRS